MSHTLKINLATWSAAIALVGTLAGSVWAVSARSSDLTHIQEKHEALEKRVEKNTARSDQDHDMITGMVVDVKATKVMVEELLKRHKQGKQ